MARAAIHRFALSIVVGCEVPIGLAGSAQPSRPAQHPQRGKGAGISRDSHNGNDGESTRSHPTGRRRA